MPHPDLWQSSPYRTLSRAEERAERDADREAAERQQAIARVLAAIKAAQDAVAAEHRRHGLNLCDVADYLTYAAEAAESEVE